MLSYLNPYLLMIISMAAGVTNSSLRKVYSRDHTGTVGSAFFALITSVVTAAILIPFILLDGFKGISPFTLLMAIPFGLCTAFACIANVKALSLGPLAFTTVITSSSCLIPTFFGVFLGQEVTVWQIIGAILLVVCMCFSVEKDPQERKASLKWLFYTMLAFVFSGSVGICQSVHQNSAYKDQLNEYLALTFLISSLIALVYYLILRKREQPEKVEKSASHPGKTAVNLLICGVGVAINNIFNLFLTGVFDTAFFFPVFNGSVLLLTVLIGLVIFRERFSRRRWIGFGFGLASLVFLLGIAEKIFGLLSSLS